MADPQEVADLSDYMLREIVGSNKQPRRTFRPSRNGPSTSTRAARWTAQKGLTWALAEGGPIDTGEPKPGEINTVGYRCMKAFKDEGPEAEKYTIKMDGCHSCPIHCYSDLRVPASAANGGYEITGNTCVPNFPFTNYMIKISGDNTSVEAGSEDALIWDQVFGLHHGRFGPVVQLRADLPRHRPLLCYGPAPEGAAPRGVRGNQLGGLQE